jgi:hypothetical protein
MTFALCLCAVTLISALVGDESPAKRSRFGSADKKEIPIVPRGERPNETEPTRSPGADDGVTTSGAAPAVAVDNRGAAPSTSAPVSSLSNALLPLPSATKLTVLDEAYLDAFTILREDNSCSSFFGGSRAIEPLNELRRRLKPGYFDRSIALKMSGATSSAENISTKVSYRVFADAEINLNGAFYRPSVVGERGAPNIGLFPPGSREARVTILLHELGHMIARPDKRWVLPDDGRDFSISRENTQRVIEACRSQIDQVSRIKPVQELLRASASSGSSTAQTAISPR